MSIVGWLCRHMPAIAVFAALLFVPANADAPGEGDTLNVILDQALIVKLPDRVATVVVGNPSIADVSLQAGGMVVLTGKGYGATNFMALDRSGALLMEKSIQVRGPSRNTVIVYRGIQRETWNCATKCEQTVTLGDSPQYFSNIVTQVETRSNQAQGAAR